MTIIIPLEAVAEAGPSRLTSNFGSASSHPAGVIEQVVGRIRSSKRIVVVSGAGVSTAAAIPDFRSSAGLYGHSDSKRKGKHTVRDLFHVRCLSSPTQLPHHYSLITELASLSYSADPTPFHLYLNALDADGKLLRCYTQNIDGLEERAGLSMGIPPAPAPSPRKKKAKPPPPVASPPSTPRRTPSPARDAPDPPHLPDEHSSKSPTPPSYRAIPLHGTLSSLHCPVCLTSCPLYPHLPLKSQHLACPTCADISSIRSALSERPRRTGYLRPSVILYGEEHPAGDLIGQVVERDLKGTGPRDHREGKVDFLLVCGTSLSIPGIKRIVKEMASSLHHRSGDDIRTVLVNDEPPKPTAEWESVFDVFIQGDIQSFVTDYLANPNFQVPTSTPKKRRPAKVDTPTTGGTDSGPVTPRSTSTKRRKLTKTVSSSSDWTTPTKSKWLPTPRPTPPVKHAESAPSDRRYHIGAYKDTSPASRKLFEGSLTPLSEDTMIRDDGENPFLDLGGYLQ